jgi:HEAT repeat protein
VRRTCSDCNAELVWLRLFDRTNEGHRTGVLFGFALEVGQRGPIGEIHGGVCPTCSRVYFYALQMDRWQKETAVALIEQEILRATSGPEIDAPTLRALVLRAATPEDSRARALEALQPALGPAQLVALVSEALSAVPPGRRFYTSATRVLLHNPTPEAFEPLVQLAPYAWPHDRRRIVTFLEALGTSAAVTVLRRWMHDTSEEVAVAAIEATVRLRPFADLEHELVSLLQHKRSAVVAAVIRALGQHGGRRYLPFFKEMSEGVLRSRRVKKAAREALVKVTAQSTLNGALTVAGRDDAGNLSVSDLPSGQLSLDGPDPES